MTFDFDFDLAPFLSQLAGFIDQEGAAYDAHEFSTIQGLLVDDIELPAQRLIRIRQ